MAESTKQELGTLNKYNANIFDHLFYRFNQVANPTNNICAKTQEIMVQNHRNCEFLYVYQLDLGQV